MNEFQVTVVGAGLAGSEAAYQLARRGIRVRLVEMRPIKMTEAHRTANFAELVCSNSLRNDSMDTAVGVLKEEMRRLGSLVIASADRARVPAGSALAVDRDDFSRAITAALEDHPMVEISRTEACEIPDGVTILATGPLTSPDLGEALNRVIGPRNLYFYDAIAPIVAADSVDMSVAFMASRYGKGGDDYINCPMTEVQYEAFVAAVVAAEKVDLHPFEKPVYFEGCMPIEEMARRGPMTLAFGPMRPVGLSEPRSGRRPFAVVQLRQDDAGARLYNMVGFQTKMTYPEQRRVLRMIPGLEKAEFVRLGSIHRNTFVDSPRLLRPTLQLKTRDDLFLAGQMVGVEGYVESAAAGLLAGINAANVVLNRELIVPPPETAVGSLIAYITDTTRRDFQPMNANYGLMPDLKIRARGREKKSGWVRERWRQSTLGSIAIRSNRPHLWLRAKFGYRKSLEVPSMTKAELIDMIARSTEQPKKQVAATLDLAFEQIARSIRKDKRFWVPGFGTFSVRRRKARAGFNPRTNAPMTIPAARTVGFRPAPQLRKGL